MNIKIMTFEEMLLKLGFKRSNDNEIIKYIKNNLYYEKYQVKYAVFGYYVRLKLDNFNVSIDLSGIDLYEDTVAAIEELEEIERIHNAKVRN